MKRRRMSEFKKLTPQEVADKLEWEGGVEAGLDYFGRELNSTDVDLNAAWRTAFDAMRSVQDLLPGPLEGFEDEDF